MGVSSILSSLRNNIVGQNSTPTNPSLPTKRTPIELSQDTGPLAGLGYDPLGFSTHAYPLDVVNNPEIGHYMLFYINVQNNTTFPYTDVRGVDIKGRTIIKEENPNLDSVQNIQAELYEKIINKMISKKSNGVVALNFWGLKDRKGGHKLNRNILSIYDQSLNPNPAFITIKRTLKSN